MPSLLTTCFTENEVQSFNNDKDLIQSEALLHFQFCLLSFFGLLTLAQSHFTKKPTFRRGHLTWSLMLYSHTLKMFIILSLNMCFVNKVQQR